VDDDAEGLTWSGLLSLGLVAAVMVVVGFALGWWADRLFDTSPIMVLVGIGLGVVASVSYTYVRIRSYLRE
jgi:F0F1-type ATP synthase assembly protein I